MRQIRPLTKTRRENSTIRSAVRNEEKSGLVLGQSLPVLLTLLRFLQGLLKIGNSLLHEIRTLHLASPGLTRRLSVTGTLQGNRVGRVTLDDGQRLALTGIDTSNSRGLGRPTGRSRRGRRRRNRGFPDHRRLMGPSLRRRHRRGDLQASRVEGSRESIIVVGGEERVPFLVTRGKLHVRREHGRRILAEVPRRLERRRAQVREASGRRSRRIHHQILGRDGARRGTRHRVGGGHQARSGVLLRGEHSGLEFIPKGMRREIEQVRHVC